MMADVVGLRDDKYTAPGKAYPAVVAKLEGYLEQARRGEIDGIALAISRPNGRVVTDYNLGPEPATFRVVAAVTLMHSDMCAVMNDVAFQAGPGDHDHSA